MKLIVSILLLVIALFARADDSLVNIVYSHSLRIPNSQIEITIGLSGSLKVTTESRGKNKITETKQVPKEKLQQLKQALEEIDWDRAIKDKTLGLDGSSVKIIYEKRSVSLWTPDSDSKRRGLERLQTAVEFIFDLAGLDKMGLFK